MGNKKQVRNAPEKDMDKTGKFAKTVVGKVFTYILNILMTTK